MNVHAKHTAAAVSAAVLLVFAGAGAAEAHFGMVVPSAPVATEDNRAIDIDLSFSHPFEGIGMDLARPEQFYMVRDGSKTDLLAELKPIQIMGNSGYRYHFKPDRPGVYHFGMEPQPYWEPIEDRFIIHYTKVVVGAFGWEDGWSELLNLPVEIRPLLRPFGNYRGNSFSGQVLVEGKPAPYAEVEVEYYNRDNRYRSPTDYHVTQVALTDGNGVFSFSCPLSGWWGFASLSLAGYTIKDQDGKDREVELGGVLWIYLDEYEQR